MKSSMVSLQKLPCKPGSFKISQHRPTYKMRHPRSQPSYRLFKFHLSCLTAAPCFHCGFTVVEPGCHSPNLSGNCLPKIKPSSVRLKLSKATWRSFSSSVQTGMVKCPGEAYGVPGIHKVCRKCNETVLVVASPGNMGRMGAAQLGWDMEVNGVVESQVKSSCHHR